MSDHQCKQCGEHYTLRQECEPTDYCDLCAQTLLAEAIKERDLFAAKAQHEHEWAEDLAKQCCEMEDALGFKQDCRGPDGEFIPTMGPWKERVRDLIAKEGELEDVRKERDDLRAKLEAALESNSFETAVVREQDRIDEEWLNAIGTQWMKLTGQPWDTKDGETREEGLESNVCALMQHIETARAERDEARAACAELRDLIKRMAASGEGCGDFSDADVDNAISTDCGRGWLSPEVGKSLVEALAHLAAYAGTVRTDRTWRMDEMNIMAEQTLDWCHGLLEKCEQADKALSRAKEALDWKSYLVEIRRLKGVAK